MRRFLAATAIAALSAFGLGGHAQAVCAGNLVCTIDGCSGTVNVCGGQSCSGGVSVCPFAHPDDCHSSVDVCLNLHVYVCISCIPPR